MQGLKQISGVIIMNSKIIDWYKLDNCFTILVTDIELQITLKMNITVWEEEHLFLDSLDYTYSMRIFRDDWADGRFIFNKINSYSQ